MLHNLLNNMPCNRWKEQPATNLEQIAQQK